MIINFEGSDGSGKETQSMLLAERMNASYVSFPTYSIPEGAKKDLLIEHLKGEVYLTPQEAAMLFIKDRTSAQHLIGDNTVLDRYMYANALYQGARYLQEHGNPDEALRFIGRMLEIEIMGTDNVQPDVVIFLDVPPWVSQKMNEERAKATGEDLDVYETDTMLRSASYAFAGMMIETRGFKTHTSAPIKTKHWIRIDCTEDGEILTPDEIHSKVVHELKNRNLID